MIDFRDRLAHLNYRQACKLLGPQAPKLIHEGGRLEIDLVSQVQLGPENLILRWQGFQAQIRQEDEKPDRLAFSCNRCQSLCVHVGAVFSLVLEEKLALGLAVAPKERVPAESLSEKELVEEAMMERREKARKEKMRITSSNPAKLWTDYLVTSSASGKTYRVALRGTEPGSSYCACPDFKINTLGTCKHILRVVDKMKLRFHRRFWKPFVHTEPTLYLRYGVNLELHLSLPANTQKSADAILVPLSGHPIQDIPELIKRFGKVEAMGVEVRIYPDAEEYIQRELHHLRLKHKIAEIRRDPAKHPLRKSLLKTELLSYQLDGIAFVVGAGRAVLADDMGLGKTIQGIGAAEMLAQETGISKVLIICPASVKSQWTLEIGRFSNRTWQLVEGSGEERASQYGNTSFFTVCNYEQVIRDLSGIERQNWDFIILDEGQRIKNWEAKTSNVIKGLRSPFALVLSGTPLENRLEELFSIVQFIDTRRLGPAFRFLHRHRLADENGKLLRYRNLEELRETLRPVLLRRTRNQVLRELPPRTLEVRRIPPTGEQKEMHDGYKRIVSQIINKKFLSEMDLLRLQKYLLLCRMSADSTALVDKQKPGYSSKLEELQTILESLCADKDTKILVFSEWTTMLDLIEPILKKLRAPFVRLDGQVPQKKRQALVREFQENPECRLFLTTNAGSTGLNLQAANTVLNVDLPWNPAVLEQRIARAHRMGQKNPVHIILLVTEGTLEEGLLGTLSSKKQLAMAALDPEAKVDEVDFVSGMDEIKGRLEILLGDKPPEPVNGNSKMEAENEAAKLARHEAVSLAGGQLLLSAFAFMGELLPRSKLNPGVDTLAKEVKERLAECMEKDEKGNLKLVLSIPGASALDEIAASLANLMRLSGPVAV